MIRDPRIKRVGKGEFRSRLSIEDVVPGTSDETYGIYNQFQRQERILVLAKQPIPVPFMEYVFHIKVKSVDDKYLKRYVFDLMYFNQGIDEVGIKKMTEFVIRTIVLFNKYVKLPCLSYEEVHPLVVGWCTEAELLGLEVLSDKVVLFEKSTVLPGEDRRKLGFETRQYRDSYLHEEAIHNKAIYLIDKHKTFAVGKKAVHDTMIKRRGLTTYKSFNKHIADKTVEVLKDTLEVRKFKSEDEANKFERFKQWRSEGINTADIVKDLGVSYSTISKYNKILKEFEEREIN